MGGRPCGRRSCPELGQVVTTHLWHSPGGEFLQSQMPVSSCPHGQPEIHPSSLQRDMVQDPASGLLPRASALVIDTSTLHLTLSLLLAPCPACHHMGVSSLCFPHLSHTPAVTHSCSQTGLKFVFCSRPILSKSLVDTAIGKT